MRTRIARTLVAERSGAAASLRADGPEVSPSHALHRARDPARGRAGAHLRRPRDGRAARGRRQGSAALPVKVPAAVGDREPPLLQLVRPAVTEGPQRLPHLRSPHGRAPALTPPAVRRLRSALLLSLLGLAVAAPGCGSDASAVEEVPGPPPTLSVPHQKGAADVSADEDATPTATPTAAGGADATPTPAGSGNSGATGAAGTNTGAAATPAPAAQDSPASDQQPAAGSPPEKFEQFCQENAGAC